MKRSLDSDEARAAIAAYRATAAAQRFAAIAFGAEERLWDQLADAVANCDHEWSQTWSVPRDEPITVCRHCGIGADRVTGGVIGATPTTRPIDVDAIRARAAHVAAAYGPIHRAHPDWTVEHAINEAARSADRQEDQP